MEKQQTPPPAAPISRDQRSVRSGSNHRKSRLDLLKEDALSFFDEPKAWFNNILYKVNNLGETNYQIAREMMQQGHLNDAHLRLKIALWFNANHQQAHYTRAACYVAEEKYDKAIPSLQRALALDPSDEKALFVLATLDHTLVPHERMPTTMPYSMAMDFFDTNAPTYEITQEDAGYRGHQLADEAVWDALDRRRRDYRVLELGSGTGLCGTLLAEHAEELTGVDFCQPMMDIARMKRRPDRRLIYTQSIFQDIRNYMADLLSYAPNYHAVVAAHVFNYVGAIENVFDGVAHTLLPGGVFVFQVEHYPNERHYGLLQELGRFGHSDAYVRHQLDRVGLICEHADDVRVFPDYTLMQYVARKPELR